MKDQITANGMPVKGQIAEHLCRGDLLDLASNFTFGSPISFEIMNSWDQSRTVEAADLRDLLCGRGISEPDPRGLRLRGARIRGRLDLDNVRTTVKLTLLDCLLEEGITAEAAQLPGLILQRCVLLHLSDEAPRAALFADGIQTEAELSLSRSVIAADASEGAIRIIGARIGGQLDCSGVDISNGSGPALDAGSLRVDGDVYLTEGFRAYGTGQDGAVRLPGAHITGQFDCSGATIENPSGPALFADSLTVDDDVHLRASFKANGFGQDGAVRLCQADVAGKLDCSGATIVNPSGPALNAGSLKVDGDVNLTEGFKAFAVGMRSTVRIASARISGELDCSGATMINPSGPALDMNSLSVEGDLNLSRGFRAEGAGDLCTLRLPGARIGGRLDYNGGAVVNRSNPRCRWLLDGLTYTRLPLGLDRQGWLALFQDAVPDYAAQPYQQLASVYRAAGHDSDVRQILIAQRQAQLDRGVINGIGERLWAQITGITLGYGYQPWRALLYLLLSVLTSALLAVILGAHGALAHLPEPNAPAAATGGPCTVMERVGVGLDLGIPLLAAEARGDCAPTNGVTGHTLTVSRQLLQLMVLGFGALFIAGFTGIVRKNTTEP